MQNLSANRLEKEGKMRDERGRFIQGHPSSNSHRHFKHRAIAIKESFCEVYEKLGGTEGLFNWIKENRYNKREFYKMILQVLPKDIDMHGEGIATKVINMIFPEGYVPKKDRRTQSSPQRIPS